MVTKEGRSVSKRRGGRNFTIICAVLLLVSALASAHSGRTDANGGHWNHSTGEYHYHTGEYAGRSQSSSKSSSKSKATSEALKKLEQKHNTNTTDERASPKKKKLAFWDVAGTVLGLLLVFGPFIAEICADIFPSNFTRKMRKLKRDKEKQRKKDNNIKGSEHHGKEK